MNIFYFMVPKSECIYLTNDTNIADALTTMENQRHSVLPLIDRDGKYAGVLKEGDLLYNIKNNSNLSFDLSNAADFKITDLDLRRYYEPIKINATEDDLFKLCMSQNFVPVTDDKGVFIGICKRTDVLKYLYKKFKKNS